MHFLILVSIILMMIQSASATNFYISSINGSASHSGLEPELPFDNLSLVHWANLHPGDTIFLEAGSTLSGPFFIIDAGTHDKPIVVTSYGSGAKPIVQNSGAWSNGIEIRGDSLAAYIQIEGIAFTGSQEGGVNVRHGAHHVTIRNCEFYQMGFGVVLHGDSNLVENNVFRDLQMIRNTLGNAGTTEADDDYGAVGVELEGSHNTVRYNQFLRLRDISFDYGYDGGAVEFYGNADFNDIYGNWVEKCNGFFEVGGGTAVGNRVHHNLAIDNFISTGWFHLTGNFGSEVEDFQVEHNTIVLRNPEPWSYILGFNGTPVSTQVLFRNNIIVSAAPLCNSCGFYHNHNIYSPVGNVNWGTTLSTEEWIASVPFQDSAKGNWVPTVESPSLNRGVLLDYPSDYYGHPYEKTFPDLGAVEFFVNSSIRVQTRFAPMSRNWKRFDLIGRIRSTP